MYLERKVKDVRYLVVDYWDRALTGSCCLCFRTFKQNNKVRLMSLKVKNNKYFENKLLRD